MYATNPLTNECVYKTPCGWCVRLEKECVKNKVKTNFTKCNCYDDGNCLGTKELDPCKEYNCEHFKDKTLINDPAFQLLLKSCNEFI